MRGIGGLLLAGGGFLAGDLLALLAWPRPSVPPGAPADFEPWVLLAGAACLLALCCRGPRLAAGWEVALPVLVAAASGFALGRDAALRSVSSCVARLEGGSPVVATGRVEYAARPRSAAGSGRGASRPPRRVLLRDVALRTREGRCRVPALVVQVARAPPVEPGDPVEARGRWRAYGPPERPRPRPLSRYGALRGRLSAASPSARGIPARGPGPAARAARWRARAVARLYRRLPAEEADLASALVLADRSGVSPAVYRRYAAAGLAHVLAISGLHVGVLAGLFAGLLRPGLPGPGRHLWAALLVGLYVAWIGAPASAVRAGLLYGGYAFARRRGSPARAFDLLGGAAAVSLLADPLAAVRPGFQLSYAGFAGLALGTAVARGPGEGRRPGAGPGRRRGAARGPALALAASLGAFACTAPVAAHHFGRAAPVAVLSHLIGAPAVGAAVLSLLAVLVLPGVLAAPFAGAARGALAVLDRSVDWLARVPGGHAAAAPPGPELWVAWALALAAAVVYLRRGRWMPTVPLAAGALAVWLSWPALAARGEGTLACFLDVGQGDAAAFRTRGGAWLVVDAGPAYGRDAGLSVVYPFLRSRGARSVDAFFLSHPHADHVGGAPALFDRLRVRRVYGAGVPYPGRRYADFLADVEREGARWRAVRPGDRVRVDELRVTVLGPVLPARGGGRAVGGRGGDPNETSVVLRVRGPGGFTVLAAGDAGLEQEADILRRWPADSLRASVLKVGHHGSRDATGSAWLRAVRPELAVVSAGRGNRHGHPHPATLRRLAEAGVGRVWRTDRAGGLCLRVGADGRWRAEAP